MLNLGLTAIPVQLPTGVAMVDICTKAIWEAMQNIKSDEAAQKISGVLIKGAPLNLCDANLLISEYKQSLLTIREECGLEVPYYPTNVEEKDAVKYIIYTAIDKMVADYANINIYDVDKLLISDYWLLERDAFISRLSQTEKGREYLNNAYRITQTEADEELGA